MNELHRCHSAGASGVDFEPPETASPRNCLIRAHIGEEKIPSPSGRAVVTLDHAKLYTHELGLQLRRRTWLHRRTWGERTHKGFQVTGYGWTAAERPATTSTIWAGLTGKFGVSLGEQESVRLIVLDLDHGHAPAPTKPCLCTPPEVCLCGFEDRTRAERRREEREELRRRVAAKARPIVEKLRRAFPGVEFAALSTPRGCHLVFLLEEKLPAEEAHELGERVLAAVGADQSEAFPKNGRLCRLPGTGSASRMLDDDLERPRHGSRLQDLAALLALRRCRPSDFRAVAIETSNVSQRNHSSRTKSPRGDSLGAAHPSHPGVTRTSEDPRDARLRETLAAKLKGDAFEAALLEVYRVGMPDDSSFDTMRKLAFLVGTAAGLASAECVRVAEAFVALPVHRATHAQTERGRRQLLQVFRSCLRHQQRGIASRDVNPAQLARPALWNMLRELLGRQPRLRVLRTLPPATREALAAAGRKRWSKDAA